MLTKEDIKEIYFDKAPSLLFFATKFVSLETAEDLVQDVFLKLWDIRLELSSTENINSYLFKMIKNACLDNIKHIKIENKASQIILQKLKIEEIMYYSENTYSNGNDRIEKINHLIEKLPPKCREIFISAYFDGKRNKDIATELNLSVKTVDAQIYKALTFLRKNLLLLIILYYIFYHYRAS